MAKCDARPHSLSASHSGLHRYPRKPPPPSHRRTPRASRSIQPGRVIHARTHDDRSTGCLEESSKTYGLSCQVYAHDSAIMQKTGVIVPQVSSTTTSSLIFTIVSKE